MIYNEEKEIKKSEKESFEEKIRERIVKIRNEKKISQEKLASMTESLEQSQISKIENNTSKHIHAYDIYQIASALDVSTSYLIDGSHSSSELTKICKYIELRYDNISYGESHYSIPIISIKKELFKFLFNEAERQKFKTMPDYIKSNWKKDDIAEFNRTHLIDSKPLEFVPLTKSTIFPSNDNIEYSHKDLINSVEQELNHAVNECNEMKDKQK